MSASSNEQILKHGERVRPHALSAPNEAGPETGERSAQTFAADRPPSEIASMAYWARLAAAGAAVIAGVGASIGLHESSTSSSWFIPILVGTGIAIFLACGWHIVLKGMEKGRERRGLGGAFVGALMLTSVAVATSTTALTSAIGGPAAQSAHQQQILSKHELALRAAWAYALLWYGLEDKATTAAASYRGLVSEETKTGCEARCEAYKRVSANYEIIGREVRREIEGLKRQRDIAQDIIEDARENIAAGDERAFAGSLARIGGVTAALSAVDLGSLLNRVGFVGGDAVNRGLDALNRIDQDMRDFVEDVRSRKTDVEIPTYTSITDNEAVMQYADRVAGAWAVALGVDLAPLVLCLLIFALAQEPLLRDAPVRQSPKDRATKIRDNEAALNSTPTLARPALRMINA